MASHILGDVAERVSAYLNGALTLNEFVDWFVPLAWEADRIDSLSARTLVRRIELEWAEHSAGHRSVDEFQRLLRAALEAALRESPQVVRASAAGRFISIDSRRSGHSG